MTVLDRKKITRMVNPQPGGNGGGGGTGGAGVYVLPAASNSELGGIKLGYPTGTGKYYPVQLDDQQRAYVNVPWTDHYAWGDITNKPSAAGGSTTPVYWNGSGFSQCTSYADASVSYADSAGSAGTAGTANYANNGNIPFMLNGASDNLPSICWHIPNTNWCNIAMDPGGNLHLTSTNVKSSTYNGLYVGALQAYGNITVGNTTIYAGGSNGGVNSLAVADDCYLGDCNIGGHLGIKSQNSVDAGISFYDLYGNGLGRVYTNGSFYFYNGSGGNATVNVGNLYSYGYVTALSDARKKNVLSDVVLSAEQLAQMPAVRFEWKDPEKPGTFIGTLAQSWSEILPEAVHTLGDGTLSFDYQSAALVSVINLAREIEAIKSKLNRYGFK